jgi:hypothetical protein
MVRFRINDFRFLFLFRQLFFGLIAYLTEDTVSIIKNNHVQVLTYYKWSHVVPHVKCLLFLSDFNQKLNVWTNLNKKSYEISWKFVVWESRRCMWRAYGQTDGLFDMTRLIASFAHAPRRVIKITEIKVENKISGAKLHFRPSNSFKFRYVAECHLIFNISVTPVN